MCEVSAVIWGAMKSAGVGPLCFVKFKVNTAVHQNLLGHFIPLSAVKLYGDAEFFFQQDLTPANQVMTVK